MFSLLFYLIKGNIRLLLSLYLLYLIFIYREIKDFLYLYRVEI